MVPSIMEKPCPQFLLGLCIVNAYVPGVIGAAIPTGWLLLIIVAPILLFTVKIKITSQHILGIAFLSYCIISLIWTPNINFGISYLLKCIALASIFCLASSLTNIKWVVIGLAIGLIPSNILALYDNSLIYSLDQTKAGLFVNPNLFCEISAAILLCLLVFKLWWLTPLALPGIVLIHSRGAILGLGVGLLVWAWQTSRRLFYILITCTVTIPFIYWNKFNVASIIERFDLWRDTLAGFKLFGNGIGSFEILYPYYATYINTALARPKFAHNDLLHLGFELGIGIVFLLLFAYRIKLNAVIVGIGVMAMFGYSFNVAITGFIWFLVAGYLSRDLPAIRDSWNNRGLHLFKGFTKQGI